MREGHPLPRGEGEGAAAFILPPSLALPRKGGGNPARETKFAAAEISEVEADGSFSGYASLFDETDLNRDRVMKGAFLKSIGKRGAAGIRMLFQHDPAAPIGVWREVREDGRGLFVRGRLMTEVAKGREVLALMRAGAIDGLSIGFRTVRGRTDAKSGSAAHRSRSLGDFGGDLPDAAGGEGAAVKGGAARWWRRSARL